MIENKFIFIILCYFIIFYIINNLINTNNDGFANIINSNNITNTEKTNILINNISNELNKVILNLNTKIMNLENSSNIITVSKKPPRNNNLFERFESISSASKPPKLIASAPRSSQVISSTSQVIASAPRSSQVIASAPRSSQVIASAPRSSQVIASAPRSSQVISSVSQAITSAPRSSQVISSAPRSSQVMASELTNLKNLKNELMKIKPTILINNLSETQKQLLNDIISKNFNTKDNDIYNLANDLVQLKTSIKSTSDQHDIMLITGLFVQTSSAILSFTK